MCLGKYYPIQFANHLKSSWQDGRININAIRQSEQSTFGEKQMPKGAYGETKNSEYKGNWNRKNNTEAETLY